MTQARWRYGPPPEAGVSSSQESVRGGAREQEDGRGYSFRQYLKAVAATCHQVPGRAWAAQAYLEKTFGSVRGQVVKSALSENQGSIGGYLVPIEFTTHLLSTIAEEVFLYPRARVIEMSSATMRAPSIDAETIPAEAGRSPFFGGIYYQWGSENAPAETADTDFNQMELRAWDLLGYAVVSNQWLADTAEGQPGQGEPGDRQMMDLFGKAGAWSLEYAFLQGTGVGQPLGILKAPCTVEVVRQNLTHITVDDISGMAATLLPSSWNRAVWACSPTCVADIMSLPNYWVNEASSAAVKVEHRRKEAGHLLGLPLYVTEKLPALGNRGDLILIDPYLYTIGERQEVLIEASTEDEGFRTQQTTFRVWLRYDGKPQVQSPITIQDTTTVVSPFVVLK